MTSVQRVSWHTAQALQAGAGFQTHMCSFTTQKVKGSDSIELTAVARAYDERIQANSSFSGFSHPNSCLSLLCSLLSPGFLIKLFEIEDKLKTPPTQRSTPISLQNNNQIWNKSACRRVCIWIKQGCQHFSTNGNFFFSGCRHKNWLLKTVKFVFLKGKKKRRERTKDALSFLFKTKHVVPQVCLNFGC